MLNDTLLTLFSGISRPCLVMSPRRTMMRREVKTYCVVIHRPKGTSTRQMVITTTAIPITQRSQLTEMEKNNQEATNTSMISTITGAMRARQCGFNSNATVSPGARSLSGYVTSVSLHEPRPRRR